MSFARTRSRGFSTIEVLVAFAILSLGLVLATRSVSQAGWSLRRAAEVSSEAELARRVMAEEVPALLKAHPFREGRFREPDWEVSIQPMRQERSSGGALVTVRIRSGTSNRFDTLLVKVLPWPSEGD